MVGVNLFQNMRGGDDRPDAVLIAEGAHLDGFLKTLGTVIQLWKDMSVEIDHFSIVPPRRKECGVIVMKERFGRKGFLVHDDTDSR